MSAGSGHSGTTGSISIVTGAGLGQRLIDARLDVAFGLAANGGEFRNHQIAGPLEHSLLPE